MRIALFYFLATISPTEESKAGERKPLRESRYRKPVKKAKAESQVGLAQIKKKGDAARQNAMIISPGRMSYTPYPRLRSVADAYRSSPIL